MRMGRRRASCGGRGWPRTAPRPCSCTRPAATRTRWPASAWPAAGSCPTAPPSCSPTAKGTARASQIEGTSSCDRTTTYLTSKNYAWNVCRPLSIIRFCVTYFKVIYRFLTRETRLYNRWHNHTVMRHQSNQCIRFLGLS